MVPLICFLHLENMTSNELMMTIRKAFLELEADSYGLSLQSILIKFPGKLVLVFPFLLANVS